MKYPFRDFNDWFTQQYGAMPTETVTELRERVSGLRWELDRAMEALTAAEMRDRLRDAALKGAQAAKSIATFANSTTRTEP